MSTPQQQEEILTNTPQGSSPLATAAKVSPSILLIIVILAVIFFVSGLLHLLVRFLLRPQHQHHHHRRRNTDSLSSSSDATAFQGQLQHLFHLHDSGLDQSFIDALPVFLYKSLLDEAHNHNIIFSPKNASPFDCAVCLCEFDSHDRLRLLPRCSHAFHVDCIDTWLLSHSTCPLCRSSLVSEATLCSPLVLVLESSGEDEPNASNGNGNDDPSAEAAEESERVVTVKLGKFRSVESNNGGVGGEGTSKVIGVDSRRCFSMGSFAYVVDESSELRVPIRNTPAKKEKRKKKGGFERSKKVMGLRVAMSECGESRREFEFGEVSKRKEIEEEEEEGEEKELEERFDDSKAVVGSRRAFSFRFQRNCNNGDLKGKNCKFPRRTVSEIGVARWGNGNDSHNNNNNNSNSELGFGGESDRSLNSLDSQLNPPSFARKTLLWLMGRQQNKVVHSSSFDPPNNV